MVDRRDIVLLSAGVLLVGVLALYGLIDFEVLDYQAAEIGFVLASVSWIIGYVYCEGASWAEASRPVKALYVVSWGMLIGMQFDLVVPGLLDRFGSTGSFAAVLIHMASFYMTGLRD